MRGVASDGAASNGHAMNGQAPSSAYRRYEITPSGISPRAIPGTEGYVHVVATDEHDQDGVLILSGARTPPPELERAQIHRLELPQGCFERRVPLPSGRYDKIQAKTVNGCLIVTLRKLV